MFSGTSQLLALAATGYGVFAALAALLQTRQMLRRRTSCDISARFFAAYAGGYAIWLLYGLCAGDVPLIVVDAVGLACGGVTLAVALALRGSLLRPASWSTCAAGPALTPQASSSKRMFPYGKQGPRVLATARGLGMVSMSTSVE